MNGQFQIFIFMLILLLIPGLYQRYYKKNYEQASKYIDLGFYIWFAIMLLIIIGIGYEILDRLTGIEKVTGVEIPFYRR